MVSVHQQARLLRYLCGSTVRVSNGSATLETGTSPSHALNALSGMQSYIVFSSLHDARSGTVRSVFNIAETPLQIAASFTCGRGFNSWLRTETGLQNQHAFLSSIGAELVFLGLDW